MIEKLVVLNLPHPAKFLAGLRTPQQLLKSQYIFFFQLKNYYQLFRFVANESSDYYHCQYI